MIKKYPNAGSTIRSTAATSRSPTSKRMVLENIDFQVSTPSRRRSHALHPAAVILEEESAGVPDVQFGDVAQDDPASTALRSRL